MSPQRTPGLRKPWSGIHDNGDEPCRYMGGEMIRQLIVLIALATLASGATDAADIAWINRDYPAYPMIAINGEIEKGDDERFARVADEARSAATIEIVNGVRVVRVRLESIGGSIAPALAIGRMIRERSMRTVVNGSCASACVFVFMAGVERVMFPGHRLGLHRPYFDSALFAKLTPAEAREKHNALLDAVRAYWDEMGGTEEGWRLMIATPSADVLWIADERRATRLGLAGDDVVWAELKIAREQEGLPVWDHVLAPPAYSVKPVDHDPFAPTAGAPAKRPPGR